MTNARRLKKHHRQFAAARESLRQCARRLVGEIDHRTHYGDRNEVSEAAARWLASKGIKVSA